MEQNKKQEMSGTKRCTKPNCNCIEIAEQKNGGNPVKSYPCLAGQDVDWSAFKSFLYPTSSAYAKYLSNVIIRNGFTQLSDLVAYYDKKKGDAKAFFDRMEGKRADKENNVLE